MGLLIAPLLLVAGVSAELVASPINVWTAKLIGTNAVACVTLIVLLSTLPFAALFYALSQGAPAEPGLAGALPESQLERSRRHFTPCIVRTIARSSSRPGTPLGLA